MKSKKYIPPYKVSGRAMNLIAEIAAAIEQYRIILEGQDGVRLRKINHFRTILGTTAIEGNTLTEAQITGHPLRQARSGAAARDRRGQGRTCGLRGDRVVQPVFHR